MTRLYRNSIVIMKNKHKILDNLQMIQIDNYFVYFDKNIPVHRTKNLLLLGWAWDCEQGIPITIDELSKVNYDDVVEETVHFSGRYLLISREGYLFTDASSSFSVYYSLEHIGTNLSMICSLINIRPYFQNKQNEVFVIPPYSGVKGIRRLMPGQYFDLKGHRAYSIKDYLVNKEKLNVNIIKKLLINELICSGKAILKLSKGDYRLMLTGGKDSRLSLLCLYKNSKNAIKAFTHMKPIFLNDPNDIKIPNELSQTLGINHIFTKTTNKCVYNLEEICKHSSLLSGTIIPGSTYYYYLKSNWNQISEKFLIDNYYEIGRMHLHNKGFTPSKEYITVENIKKYGYVIDERLFPEFLEHLKIIGGSIDMLDTYYFVKNYINVANQFELIDYSHNPLIYCSSLKMFRLLLHIPSELRRDGKFHLELVSEMTPQNVILPECNKNSKSITSKLKRKIRNKLGRIFS